MGKNVVVFLTSSLIPCPHRHSSAGCENHLVASSVVKNSVSARLFHSLFLFSSLSFLSTYTFSLLIFILHFDLLFLILLPVLPPPFPFLILVFFAIFVSSSS